MGQITGKPLIIEFNGIPGAGKTTTAFEVGRRLRDMGIREISSKEIARCKADYKDILQSKEIKNIHAIFLKSFLLISPMTRERMKFMDLAFNYWFGIRKLRISGNRRSRVCILDQGVIQSFVSMAYLGKIRNEEKYYRCIAQVMNSLDNMICVNCIVDTDTSIRRMRSRKPNGGRLHQVHDDNKLRKILKVQAHQFERIREKAIKRSITINMNEPVEYNVEKIVEYCMKYL